METGQMPAVSYNKDTKAGQQQVINVDFKEMMTQSSSRSRGGRMDLKEGAAESNDQYC